jgi:putative Mg2+ transporter-C (MgtC) family protein
MQLEEMTLRLVISFVAGGIVGIERERKDRPAGLRTHMLVAGGSTLLTLVSMSFTGDSVDPTRIAAQIVTGIGFLGAGTIFRSGTAVRGLTTAAGLWTVAGIGMAIAAGGTVLYLGLITAVCVFFINRFVAVLEGRMLRDRYSVTVHTVRDSDVLTRLVEALHSWRVTVHEVHWVDDEAEPGIAVLELRLDPGRRIALQEVGARIGNVAGVKRVSWD